MPKKKEVKVTVQELVEELQTPELIDELPVEKKPRCEETESKREDLMKLAMSGELSKTPAQITKASAKVIEKLWNEWEAMRMERANNFLCDQLISKFSSILGGLDAIESPEEMEELINDPLLREDIERVVCMITPWIPFLGIFSGGITVGKHVLDHIGKKGVAFGGESPTEEEIDLKR